MFELTWAEIKKLMDDGFRYTAVADEFGNTAIHVSDKSIIYRCFPTGADLTDYTNNYASGKSVYLENKAISGLPAIAIGSGTDGTAIGNIGDRLKFQKYPAPTNKVIYKTEPFLSAGSKDMTVDGSVTPVVFSTAPGTGETWYVQAMNLFIHADGTNRYQDFGSIVGGLTNGLLIEQVIDSTNYELAVIDDNSEIVEHWTYGNLRGIPNSFITQFNFFAGRLEFKHPITLVQADGDKLQTTVRDDLTDLNKLEISIDAYRIL